MIQHRPTSKIYVLTRHFMSVHHAEKAFGLLTPVLLDKGHIRLGKPPVREGQHITVDGAGRYLIEMCYTEGR